MSYQVQGLLIVSLSHVGEAVLTITRNLDSLASKILMGRCYKDGFFLKAPVENKSSLIWYGISWGRKLFMKGLRWRVGNGRRIINIDQD